jgi:hypothetical protein
MQDCSTVIETDEKYIMVNNPHMFAIKFSITLEIFEGVMVLGHLMHLY